MRATHVKEFKGVRCGSSKASYASLTPALYDTGSLVFIDIAQQSLTAFNDALIISLS
jgi:hypothetical protein